MTHKNLECYNNYEIFTDVESESRYRQSRLDSSDQHFLFVKKIFNNRKINVLELGSGNSKTLYNFSIGGILKKGYGFEISESRHLFAERWKTDLNISNVENILDNFLNIGNHNIKNVDLCFIVDLAFQFCEPIKKGSDEDLLIKIYDTLNKNGKLIIELDGCGRIIQSIKNNNKIWEEFEINDPWQYSLWNCEFEKENKILYWEKTFIHRYENSKDNKKVELKIYDKKSIKKLLKKVGFRKIKFFSDWDFSNSKNDFGNFIVVCEK